MSISRAKGLKTTFVFFGFFYISPTSFFGGAFVNTIIKGEVFLNELSDCQRRKRDCLIIGMYGYFCT